MLSHQEARRRVPGQPLASSRLQTPSLTTATSRSSSMTSGAFATTDSAFATTVVAEERLSPPLIELDDGVQQAPPLTRRLAYEAGAGITPTDKLRALLRQMESEARAAKPSQLPSTHAPASSSSAYRESSPSVPAPIPYPSSGEDDDGQYSPPSPPPRISNPYLYSRRATERREVDDVVAPRSPEQPRRLPSRAIALRAAAAAVEAQTVETVPRRETAPPTPLETFIASNHGPSTSRRRMESAPRPPSPKGKERAEDRYDPYDEDEYVASPPRRRAALPVRQYGDDEDMPNYEGERSPPRRRMPIRRSIQAPDTSAAFAAGLHGLEEADEFDLEDDSMIPWNEDDTLDSAAGARGDLASSQSNRSHSREYAYPNTPKTASFTTASAGRTLRQSPGPGDTSLPPVPGPESSDEEEENTALHARAAMFRPSPRASPEPWSSSHRTSVSSRDRTTFTDARSVVVHDSPRESTRFEQAGESTRYQSARVESSLEEQNDRFALSNKSLLSQGSLRSLRDSHGEDAPLRASASSGVSHRPSPPRRSPKAELRQSPTTSPRPHTTTTPPKRVALAAPGTPPPAAEDSDTPPQSTPESARSKRLRESRENRSGMRASTSPRQSPPARASASVRWSDDTEQSRADMSLPTRLSSEASMHTVELTPPDARRHLPEVNPPRAVPSLPATTSPVSTPLPRAPLPATPAMKTPRPPGAWGTPPVRGPVTPAPPAPAPSAGLPRTPVVDIPDLVGLPTPRPPGAWRTPAPAAKPSTPVAPPTVGTVGGPTPRPPGAWYTPTVTRGSTVPFRFSALRNEVRPDDTMSSTSSLHESIGDVSVHRLRSPKQSPMRNSPSKTSPGNNNFLSAPVFGSPKRSPTWSPLSRPAYPPPSMPLPVTPTKSQQSHLQDDDGDGVDPDMSWTMRLKRAVMSPVRRPPPSTAFSDAKSALEAASRASAQARSRVEAAQRAWASALASVPADPEPRAQPVKVVEVARRGYSWGVFMLWAVLELFLFWCVFRITLDYASSSRLLAAIDPFHPQLGSYALGIPMPAALEAFTTRRAAPANLFDILDSFGLGLGGVTAQQWAPPS